MVEQNRDGQMSDLVRLEVGTDAAKIRPVLHYIGLPIDARFVTDAILELERGAGPADEARRAIAEGASR